MRLSLAAWLSVITVIIGSSCINPFAPRLDNSLTGDACDPTDDEGDGVFECFQQAYSSRDTTLYGDLLDASFTFVFRNYELGIDETWGRDEELRITYELFQSAQRLDLIWNNIVSRSADSTRLNVVRGFNLTVVSNPSDIQRADGYANLILERRRSTDPWKIIRWRDESNF